ncbi:MAG TPA: hypothetical protein VNH53_03915 [Sphingomicrobium sp.]|nr:hypothetical protein [Sphingomicrobium sp.]
MTGFGLAQLDAPARGELPGFTVDSIAFDASGLFAIRVTVSEYPAGARLTFDLPDEVERAVKALVLDAASEHLAMLAERARS